MTEQELRDYCLNNKEKILKAMKSRIVEYPIPDGAWVANLADRIVEPYDEKKFYEYDVLKRLLCHIFPSEEDARSYLNLHSIIENAIEERIVEGFKNDMNYFASIESLAIGDRAIKFLF